MLFRERHKKSTSSHKSSRHKKDIPQLDNKSKEILEQLVDKQIVPPLENRLWKHVPHEDMTTGIYLHEQRLFNLINSFFVCHLAPNPDSDSDNEPSSTVTIPTPPRTTGDVEEATLNKSVLTDVTTGTVQFYYFY